MVKIHLSNQDLLVVDKSKNLIIPQPAFTIYSEVFVQPHRQDRCCEFEYNPFKIRQLHSSR